MGVVLEALHELLHVLVEHRVQGDFLRPRFELRLRGQLAEQIRYGGLDERAVLRQLFDRVAPVEQDALVAVDVGDSAAARRGVLERRVVRHQPEVVVARTNLAKVHRLDRAVGDGNLIRLAGAVVLDRQRICHDSSGYERCSVSPGSSGTSGVSSSGGRSAGIR
jgi:hypothetical protein